MPPVISEIPALPDNPPDEKREPQREPLFAARGLTKVYRMGEVEVAALRGVDIDLFDDRGLAEFTRRFTKRH